MSLQRLELNIGRDDYLKGALCPFLALLILKIVLSILLVKS